MTTPWLTTAEFLDETVMPAADVAEMMAISPKWLPRQLEKVTGWIESRLRKRYATPFVAPYPEACRDWLCRIVTRSCYLRRGVDPSDEQAAEILKDAETAKAEVLEAAEAEKGLFDLPLRADLTATGIVKGGPKTYAEASPYVAFSRQGERGTNEDENGGGSYFG